MKSKEYTPLAVRTEGAPIALLSTWLSQHAERQLGVESTPVDSTRLLHGLMGFGSEIFELEFETELNSESFHNSVGEEIGDHCWYLAVAREAVHDDGSRITSFYEDDMPDCIRQLQLVELPSPGEVDCIVDGLNPEYKRTPIWDYHVRELRRQIGLAFEHGKALIFYNRLMTKKESEYGYSAPVPTVLHTIFDNIDTVLELIATRFGAFDIEVVREKNIEKLAKRYPEKFTADLANARLDKAAG